MSAIMPWLVLDQTCEQVLAWIARWIGDGFAALETLIARYGAGFAFGDRPGFAELHLVPQMYNCRRFDCDLTPFPRLVEIDRACRGIEAFQRAAPERMPDYDGLEPAWLTGAERGA